MYTCMCGRAFSTDFHRLHVVCVIVVMCGWLWVCVRLPWHHSVCFHTMVHCQGLTKDTETRIHTHTGEGSSSIQQAGLKWQWSSKIRDILSLLSLVSRHTEKPRKQERNTQKSEHRFIIRERLLVCGKLWHKPWVFCLGKPLPEQCCCTSLLSEMFRRLRFYFKHLCGFVVLVEGEASL